MSSAVSGFTSSHSISIEATPSSSREDHRASRFGEAAGGQRARAGAGHGGVDALVEHLVERGGAGRGQADAQVAQQQQRPSGGRPGVASSEPTTDVSTISATTRGLVSAR